MFNLNWGLLRHALFTYRKGSALKASEALNVTHATVIRSLKRLEEESGTKLFNKSSSGYTPTDKGKLLIETAEKIESLIYQWKLDADKDNNNPSGLIKITTTEAVMDYMLCPQLNNFYQMHPDVDLQVTTSNGFKNIAHHEFDVALRSTSKPPEHLIGRKVAELHWGVYAAKNCQDNDNWIGLTDISLLPMQWLKSLYPNANIKCKSSSIVSLLAATRSGLGKSILPNFVAEKCTDLQLIEPLSQSHHTDLWLLYHTEARNCSKVQAFVKWFYSTNQASLN
ncbi:LysR family transcriptional regulator [Catenovulum sp. SX2]|uniref:LysR family transcriptional regulator n=1 Tax=Catenovulum sp. SX2 TaxID=3398614 RepID=UPI003F876570